MADTKISALTDGAPAQSGDIFPVDRAGANFRLTAANIITLGVTLNAAGAGGLLVPPLFGTYTQGISTLFGATNEMDGIRFVSPITITCTHLTYIPTVSAGAGTHIGFAIYNSAGSSRLMTTGALDGTLTGKQTVTVASFTLNAGTPYIFAWTSDAATVGTWSAGAWATIGSAFANLINGIVANFVKGANASVAGAPPASLGALTAITTGSGIPVAWIEP